MNKKTLYFAPFFLGLMFASCDKEDDGPGLTTSLTYNVYNLVTPLDKPEDAVATAGKYKVNYDQVSQLISLDASGLKLDGNTETTFSTKGVKFTRESDEDAEGYSDLFSIPGAVPMATPVPVSDMNFMVTSNFYGSVAPVPGLPDYTEGIPQLYIQYKYDGKYLVKTFGADTSFMGTTVTTYPSKEGMSKFENDGITYRLVLDVEKKKAAVVLYNARFAAPAPQLAAVVLRDLDLVFENGGYTVSGADLTPDVLEAGECVPNTRYVFNSFRLQNASSDLAGIEIEYTVAKVFKGTFTGSALKK